LPSQTPKDDPVISQEIEQRPDQLASDLKKPQPGPLAKMAIDAFPQRIRIVIQTMQSAVNSP
jgi:hypothetical protein